MLPKITRARGQEESSSFQQQPTPALKETEEIIEVLPEESDQEEEEVEEVPTTESGKGKERELTTDERLDLVAEKHAVKKMHDLKQTTSAAEYTTEFNRLAAISKLPQSALFFPFYDGLKEQVKDEMFRVPKTGPFKEYTDKAIISDRRTFDRYLKRRGTGRRNGDKRSSSNKKTKDRSQKEASVALAESKKDKSKVECFNCGKKGHFKSECHFPAKKGNPQKNHQRDRIPQPKKKVRAAERDIDSEDEDEKETVKIVPFARVLRPELANIIQDEQAPE
ncbi:hypothetical protein DL767_007878 [Monosporascus sp. MG133]|nr:hypothetical protein DL767_007878 [Monosporascus sp. MG133]